MRESENRLMVGTLYTDRNRSEKPRRSNGQSKVAARDYRELIRMRAKAINKTIRLDLSNVDVSQRSVRS